ncbi:MAG: APC family permease [Vulcanisaeta sp.]|uniref:APC family permease n=1 Tax=Vulcanisaeta sp. TaxID=2020871 RepID=UPI003D115B5F
MSLKRTLKFNRLVAVTMGTPLASSVFPSIMLLDLMASSLINEIVAILVATALVIMSSFAYSELVSIYPTAAGNRVFLRRPLGDAVALGLSLMWVFITLGAAGVEGYVVGYVLYYLISLYVHGALLSVLTPLVLSLIVMTLISIINIIGVEISGNFQMGVTYFIAASLIAVSIISAFISKSITAQAQTLGSFNPVNALSAAAVGVYFFLGYSRVTTLGEEATDYRRSLPMAIPIGVSILGVVFISISTAIFMHVPIKSLISILIPQILLGKYLLGGEGVVFMVIISVLMSFSAFNAGALGTSRLIYALGREGTLPRFLGRVHRRFFTPYTALLFLYAVAVAMLFIVTYTKSFSIPLYVAAGFDSFMYAAIGYSALWHLRHVNDIPFRVKGGLIMYIIAVVAFTLLGILLLLTTPPIVALVIILGTAFLIVYARYRIKTL